MNLHLGCTATLVILTLVVAVAQTLRTVRSHNISPQHTCSAEFGYFKEVVGTDTEIELNLLGYHCSRQTGINQLIHIFITPSQSITQLLENIRTCIV